MKQIMKRSENWWENNTSEIWWENNMKQKNWWENNMKQNKIGGKII